jgi:hypothetical protein
VTVYQSVMVTLSMPLLLDQDTVTEAPLSYTIFYEQFEFWVKNLDLSYPLDIDPRALI